MEEYLADRGVFAGEDDRLNISPDFIPNLFILGAAKCGTTTLHQYLNRLPDICMSEPKEPFYFEAEYGQGIEFYRKKYFAHWHGEAIKGDARHRNLLLPFIPDRIRQVNPDAKLIVLVRNPTDRAFSHWYHNYSRDSEDLSFPDAIEVDLQRIRSGLRCDTEEEILQHIERLPRPAPGKVIGLGLYRTYLDSGYYFEQIERYLALFPEGNLKIILFDDLVQQPQQVMADVLSFLGLEKGLNMIAERLWANPARPLPKGRSSLYTHYYQLVQNPGDNLFRLRSILPDRLRKFIKYRLMPVPSIFRMDPETRNWLNDHYLEHNDKLAGYLGTDTSNWI